MSATSSTGPGSAAHRDSYWSALAGSRPGWVPEWPGDKVVRDRTNSCRPVAPDTGQEPPRKEARPARSRLPASTRIERSPCQRLFWSHHEIAWGCRLGGPECFDSSGLSTTRKPSLKGIVLSLFQTVRDRPIGRIVCGSPSTTACRAPALSGRSARSRDSRLFRHVPWLLSTLHSRPDHLQSMMSEGADTTRSRRAYLRLGSLGVISWFNTIRWNRPRKFSESIRINSRRWRKKEIRAFQDRSGWRFRSQEIDEMARERGFGSDPELPLGEAAKGKSGDSGGKDVFNFSLDVNDSDEVPLGKQPPSSEKPSRSGSSVRVKRAVPNRRRPRRPATATCGWFSTGATWISVSLRRTARRPLPGRRFRRRRRSVPANRAWFRPPRTTAASASCRWSEPSDSDVKIVPVLPAR